MSNNFDSLDFEQPISDLQAKIKELRLVGSDSEIDISAEIKRLEAKSEQLTKKIFKSLTDWQIAQLARHPKRPHTSDYIQHIFNNFQELHGDRLFADDAAIIAGTARLDDQPVMIIGQEKGRDTKNKIKRNFGMPHPEGYRKALRLMRLAEQFKLPLITFIDTPGAYPGIEAEARGQSEAIAHNLQVMSSLKIPIIAIIIGEGCSGGALGIGVADKTLMLQYSYYATISPEGCASILWKDSAKAGEAAEIMGITGPKLKKLGLIDDIVQEPLGGAHRDLPAMADFLKFSIKNQLTELQILSVDELLQARYKKYSDIGLNGAD